MQISLYICTADKERVDKSNYMTLVGAYDGYLRKPSSVINPVIELDLGTISPSSLQDEDDEIVLNADNNELVGSSSQITDANYMVIPEFNRAYFITDIVVSITGIFQIHAKVDVLHSFKDYLLALNCFVSRNEFDFDAFEQDDYLPLKYVKDVYEGKPDRYGTSTLTKLTPKASKWVVLKILKVCSINRITKSG